MRDYLEMPAGPKKADPLAKPGREKANKVLLYYLSLEDAIGHACVPALIYPASCLVLSFSATTYPQERA